MREILFRGKRVDNGKWVYGSYINSVVKNSVFGYIGGNNVIQPTRIIKKTLGQFTGCYDAFGTKIFEGDILKSELEIDGKIFVEYLYVFWSDEEAAFLCWNNCQKDIPMRMEKYIFENAGVYDNIHDIPDYGDGRNERI